MITGHRTKAKRPLLSAYSEEEGNTLAGNTDIVLETRGFYKAFPGTIATNNVSFDVHRQEVHAIIGGKWCRKKHTLQAADRAIPAGSGRHYLHGE